MKPKKLNRIDEIKESLKKIMIFEDVQMLNEAAEGISDGYSIVVDALSYRGNGHWVAANRKDRYKYKMIVPIMSNSGILYSTDLFKGGMENAINGKYAVYSGTRQLVLGVLAKIQPDFDNNRFESGYKDGNYGINILKK